MAGYPKPPEREDTDVIGSRIGAQIVDSIVMGVIFIFSIFLLGGIGTAGGEEGAAGGFVIGLFLGFVGAVVYGLLLEGLWDGYTVGKKLFGIKVVKETGDQCTIGPAFLRNLLEILDGLFYYVVGFIVMAMSEKRQRIGDRLAGTVVVRETPRDHYNQEERETVG